MQHYLGQITMFAGNFAPKGWAFCQGQLMAIAQNQALFSVLGTTYGGDGRTTFGLPDLRGRAPVSAGQGPGISVVLGQKGGSDAVTLTVSQIPAHVHAIAANNTTAATGNPSGAYYGKAADAGSGTEYQIYQDTANTTLNPGALANAGGTQPHSNLPPLIALNYIICTSGLFPSRN